MLLYTEMRAFGIDVRIITTPKILLTTGSNPSQLDSEIAYSMAEKIKWYSFYTVIYTRNNDFI
jgi:hypothetical protein